MGPHVTPHQIGPVEPRSLLFVPGDQATKLLPKALRSGADATIIDLEDAVAPARKAEAQANVRAAVAAYAESRPLFIRINGPSSPWFESDLRIVAGLRVTGVVLPKCENADSVRQVAARLREEANGVPAIIAIIESALGVLAAAEIATADRGLVGIGLGAEDLAAEVRMRRTRPGDEILFARSIVVLAAAAAHIWAIDTPCLELLAPDVVREEATLAASLGFCGKFAVHPMQIEPLHQGFAPSPDDVNWANAIIRASEEETDRRGGAAAVSGQMIDRPVIEAARNLLARAARSTKSSGGA